MTTKKSIIGLKELEGEFGKLTFGRVLEAFRLSEEVSQRDFAKTLGISPASLCDLEKGRRIPSPARAAAVAKKLRQPPSYWVQLALQDQINEAGLKMKVSVA
jgi:transcriptional regulator with XRE-family HTH domain